MVEIAAPGPQEDRQRKDVTPLPACLLRRGQHCDITKCGNPDRLKQGKPPKKNLCAPA